MAYAINNNGVISRGAVKAFDASPGVFAMRSDGRGAADARCVRTSDDGKDIELTNLPCAIGFEGETYALTLYGTGEQTRSFCYVDDLVEGLVRLMAADGRHEPVNLGNPVEFTIKELAERVSRIVGGEVKTVYRPLPQDDPTQRQPDITRAREWLGWEPQVPLAEGLVSTVAYFRERLRLDRPTLRSGERVSSDA